VNEDYRRRMLPLLKANRDRINDELLQLYRSIELHNAGNDPIRPTSRIPALQAQAAEMRRSIRKLEDRISRLESKGDDTSWLD
jgi:hypothetical protein